MATFLCQGCKRNFEVQDKVIAKYPNWQPKLCIKCKNTSKRSSSHEENLTLNEVLAKYTTGLTNGVFTDGAAEPNPGPGGWGAVYIVNNVIVAQDYGQEQQTTNNRMELIALIEACRMIPYDTKTVIYTDSELCVNICTKWAMQWEAKGWKRNKGKKHEIKNLELIQILYGILKQRPEIEMQWVRSHSGNRWNEYADSLATAYRRSDAIAKIGEKFDLEENCEKINSCGQCYSNQWDSETIENWIRYTCRICGNEIEIEAQNDSVDHKMTIQQNDDEKRPGEFLKPLSYYLKK